MIPVLICPFLRPDLVGEMAASVDVEVGRWITIDQGSGADAPGVIHLPANIGVAAAWNLGIKLTADAPWWLITNDDVTFAAGDLDRLSSDMEDESAHLATLDGLSVFGVNRAAIEAVGFFDENYHPAYVEDCDYEYRCKLASIPIRKLDANLKHVRSATIAIPRWQDQNARTYPRNAEYHVAKWGGSVRSGEHFATPFDKGGHVGDWRLDLQRLRSQRWTG